MSLEELTKTQIILLTLLISFITSIATGIVTVSLVDQAPIGFTQTVNRVVERTVEKVVPTQVAGINTVTKETTVVVKEEDVIATSIESVSSSIVSVKKIITLEDGTTSNLFLGWGMHISSDGLIATDSAFVGEGETYFVTGTDEKVWNAKTVIQDEERGLAILKVETIGTTTSKFKSVKISSIDDTRLGQTVIAFGGNNKRSVAIGIISSFDRSLAEGNSTSTSSIIGIEVSGITLPPATGGPLSTIFGEVIGMKVDKGEGKIGYLPMDLVRAVQISLPKTP